MNSFERLLKDKLHQYKFINDERYIIPVYNENTDVVAKLIPLGIKHKHNIPNCVELFNKWREENPTGAYTYFKITVERTEIWMNGIINDDNDIIFFVKDCNDKFIGHFGCRVRDYVEKEVEIRWVIRGEKTIQRAMEHSMRTFLSFLRNTLGLQKVWLTLYADNTHAMNFYKKCGFKKNVLIPYKRVQIDDELQCIECELGEHIGYFLKMEL